MTPSQTWQQLVGQPLPPGMTPVPENPSGNVIGPGGVVVMNCTPEEKLQRELFVGNTTPEMTESMLKDFLGRALEQVGLTIMPGNPILACRVSGKFAFVELRSKEEAANALNLNNIPYLGAQLRVGRPSKVCTNYYQYYCRRHCLFFLLNISHPINFHLFTSFSILVH